MISAFDYKDFRAFIRARFKEMPKAGYGQSLKLAQALGVTTTLVSQVMHGSKTFTLEQAEAACGFLGLDDLEAEYFHLLVQLDRAGTPALRARLTRQLTALHKRAQELSSRFAPDGKLSEEQRAIFYSDWTYAAIRQLAAIPRYQSLEAVSSYFGLSRPQAKKIVDFLLLTQLCVETKGALKIGPASTHVESASAWARMHHVNWRQKCIESLHHGGHAALHFTAPLTLAHEDAVKVREMIVSFLESVKKVVQPSKSEDLRCLTVDWFEVKR